MDDDLGGTQPPLPLPSTGAPRGSPQAAPGPARADGAGRGTAPTSAWLALTLAAPAGGAFGRGLLDAFPDPTRLGECLARALGAERGAARAARERLTAPRGPLEPAHVAALGAPATARRVEEALRWLDADPAHRIVPIDDPRYPPSLRAIAAPPPLLYLRGDARTLAPPAVAVIGSRDASGAGRERAARIGADLAAAGIVVVSGLALGVDAAAHAGALGAGGLTLAFTATGVDRVYPRRHARLLDAMLERGGAVASEFPLGHPPRPWGFPRRNRLISGACLGVVVVEAALPSGSLTTARHAAEQGREVMAVPGAVEHPGSAGCHALIRDGATLVSGAADVLALLATPLAEALGRAGEDAAPAGGRDAAGGDGGDRRAAAGGVDGPGALPRGRGPAPAGAASLDDPIERLLWRTLGREALTLETLAARCDVAVPALLGALVGLELAGLVVRESGGRFARAIGRGMP